MNMQSVERNERFELAYRFVTETQESVFLTGKAGTPEDIAEAVMWLCSDYSSYVIGVNLTVDGGALING